MQDIRIFKKMVIGRIGQKLSGDGWKIRNRGSLITKDLSNDLYHAIGLVTVPFKKNESFEICPSFLIGCHKIETIFSEIFAVESKKYSMNIITTNIGYYKKENTYHCYVFSIKEDIELVVNEMLFDIEKYGIDFFSKYQSIQSLVDNLIKSDKEDSLGSAIYAIPTALIMLGDVDKAKKYLYKKVSALSNNNSSDAVAYRKFVTSAIKYIDNQS